MNQANQVKNMGQQPEKIQEGFDPSRRYVRVCETRPDGFVEFEFAIGDPELCVELMLPEVAFNEFCLANDAFILAPATPGQGDWAARLNSASQKQISDAV